MTHCAFLFSLHPLSVMLFSNEYEQPTSRCFHANRQCKGSFLHLLVNCTTLFSEIQGPCVVRAHMYAWFCQLTVWARSITPSANPTSSCLHSKRHASLNRLQCHQIIGLISTAFNASAIVSMY